MTTTSPTTVIPAVPAEAAGRVSDVRLASRLAAHVDIHLGDYPARFVDQELHRP